MADKENNNRASEVKAWSGLVDQINKVTKDAPTWIKWVTLPVMVIAGVVFAFNPGLGSDLTRIFVSLVKHLVSLAGEGIKKAKDGIEETGADWINGFRNYFSLQRRRRWQAGFWIYLLGTILLIVIGLTSPQARIALAAGMLLLTAPILLLAGLMASFRQEVVTEADKNNIRPKIGRLGSNIIYFILIGLLLMIGWLFSGNLPIWGAVATAWLSLILIFNFTAKPGKGLKNAYLVLSSFIGALLLSGVGVMIYDHNPTFQRTVDATHYFSLGKTARLMNNGALEKEAGEIQDKVATKLTKLWATEPKKKAPSGFSLNLNEGDTVVVAVTQLSEDDFGMSYYRTRQRKADGTFNDGWVAARDLKPVEKRLEPRPTASQASLKRPTDQQSFTVIETYDYRQGEMSIGPFPAGTILYPVAQSRLEWDPAQKDGQGGLRGSSRTPESCDCPQQFPARNLPFGALIIDKGNGWEIFDRQKTVEGTVRIDCNDRYSRYDPQARADNSGSVSIKIATPA